MGQEHEGNNSFLYFAISMLIVFLLPLTYYVLKHPIRTFILHSYKKHDLYRYADASMGEKVAADQRERKYVWFSRFYVFRVRYYCNNMCS